MQNISRAAVALVGALTAATAYGWGYDNDQATTSIIKDIGESSIVLSRVATYEGNISGSESDACDDFGGVKEARANGGAEILTYDRDRRRLFITKDERQDVECNDEDQQGDNIEFEIPIFRGVDVVDIRVPSKPKLVRRIDVSEFGRPTSVAVCHGRRFLAVAIAADPDFIVNDQGELEAVNGVVGFYNKRNGRFIRSVEVGSLPDMITCTPDGQKLLVANEAEPERNVYFDPEGSVSIIDVSHGVRRATVTTADFNDFDAQKDELTAAGVRIFGPGSSVSQDLEPEYIAVTPDSSTAFVTLQENNAVAKLDIYAGVITDVFPLGYKDHGVVNEVVRNGLDPSNRDDGRIIRPWPVLGMYQADAIGAYMVDGVPYFVTANEGDARDYDAFDEEARIGDFFPEDPMESPLCPGVFDQELGDNDQLGRLKTTTAPPERGVDPSGCFNELFAYGGRSFSIYDGHGNQVFDSGDDFEQITSVAFPENFNSEDDESGFDGRSDDKGPEPEGVAIGKIGDFTYAFVLLERIGGVMTYDITDPFNVKFVQYINNRDFVNDSGDKAPEGVVFIPAADSPGLLPLIAVAHETSGTTTIFRIRPTNVFAR